MQACSLFTGPAPRPGSLAAGKAGAQGSLGRWGGRERAVPGCDPPAVPAQYRSGPLWPGATAVPDFSPVLLPAPPTRAQAATSPSVRPSLGATGDPPYHVRGTRPGGRGMVAGRQNRSLRSEYFLFFSNFLSRAVCDSFQPTPGRNRFSFLWLLGGSGGQCDPRDCFSTIIIHCLTHEAASTAVIIPCLYVGKLRL